MGSVRGRPQGSSRCSRGWRDFAEPPDRFLKTTSWRCQLDTHIPIRALWEGACRGRTRPQARRSRASPAPRRRKPQESEARIPGSAVGARARRRDMDRAEPPCAQPRTRSESPSRPGGTQNPNDPGVCPTRDRGWSRPGRGHRLGRRTHAIPRGSIRDRPRRTPIRRG